MLRWAVIAVLLLHGVGHIMGFLAAWTTIPVGFTSSSWMLSNNVTVQSAVGRAFGILWLVALVAFLGATFGLVTHQAWWRTMAVAAAFISLVAIVPWWNTVTPGSRMGAFVVDLVLIVGLLPAWGEQIAQRLG